MCHWSKGMQIRYNVAQVEQWARDAKIHDNDRQLFSIDTLEPIIQAAALLQVCIFKDFFKIANFENIQFVLYPVWLISIEKLIKIGMNKEKE